MLDFDTVVLENGVEYTEIDKLVCDNIEYVLLSNIKNVKDSCIRKIEIENEEEYLCRLDSPSEYEKILKLFVEKNKALFD